MLQKGIEGSNHDPLVITWSYADGSGVVDLTGTTITGTIKAKDGTKRTIAGELDLVIPTQGIFRWTLDLTDLAPGLYTVQFIATFSDSRKSVSFSEGWEVEALQ